MNTDNSGNGAFDGSNTQWPIIAILTAKNAGNYASGLGGQQCGVNLHQRSDNNAASALWRCRLRNPTHWNNSAKTGGGLVGYYLGGKLISAGDVNATRALNFLRNFYTSATQTGSGAQGGGWFGEFYAMFRNEEGTDTSGGDHLYYT